MNNGAKLKNERETQGNENGKKKWYERKKGRGGNDLRLAYEELDTEWLFSLFSLSQECQYSHKQQNSESDWFSLLTSHLGESYVKLGGLSLMSLRLCILVRRDHYYKITHVKVNTEIDSVNFYHIDVFFFFSFVCYVT